MPPIITFRTPGNVVTSSLTGMTGNERGVAGPWQTYRVYNDYDLDGASVARMVKAHVFYQMEVGGLYRSSGVEAADQQWMEAELTGVTFDLNGAPVDGETTETTAPRRFGGKTAFELPGVIPAGFGREIRFRLNATGAGGSVDFQDIRIGLSWDRGTDFLDTAADEREGRGILAPGGQKNWLLGGRALTGANVGLSPIRHEVFIVENNAAGGGGETVDITTSAVTTTFTAVLGAPGALQFQVGATAAITATNLATAINTAAISVYAQALTLAGRAAVRLQSDDLRMTLIASSDPAFIIASHLQASLLFNEITTLDPEETFQDVARQVSYPPFNDVDASGVNLAAAESYVIDSYKTPILPVYRIYMYAAVINGATETVTIRVGGDSSPDVFTGVVGAPGANQFRVDVADDGVVATNLATAINTAAIGVTATATVDESDENYVTIVSNSFLPLEISSSENKAWVAHVSDYVHVRGDKGTPGEAPASPGTNYIHISRSAKVYGASLSTPELMATHAHARLTATGADSNGDLGGYFAVIGGLVMRDDAQQVYTAGGGPSTRQYAKLTNGGLLVIDQTAPAPGEIFLGIVETNGGNDIDFVQDRSIMLGRGTRLTRTRHIKESLQIGAAGSLNDEAYLLGVFKHFTGSAALPRTVSVAAGHKISVYCTSIPAGEEDIIELTGTELLGDGAEVASQTERFLATTSQQWFHGKKRWMGTGANTPDVTVDSAGLATAGIAAYASDLFQNDYRPFIVRSLKLKIVPVGAVGQITAELIRIPSTGIPETIFSVTKTAFPNSAAYVGHVVNFTKRPSGGLETNVPHYATADEAVIDPWKGEGIYLKLSAFEGIVSVDADLEIDERLN